MPIKLQQVKILPEKYIAVSDGIIQEVSSIEEAEKINPDNFYSELCFDTVDGKLANNQYATQANGYHWIKIADYKMTKIAPTFIKNGMLSDEGIIDLKFRSELE